jgi:hypothetical protein
MVGMKPVHVGYVIIIAMGCIDVSHISMNGVGMGNVIMGRIFMIIAVNVLVSPVLMRVGDIEMIDIDPAV